MLSMISPQSESTQKVKTFLPEALCISSSKNQFTEYIISFSRSSANQTKIISSEVENFTPLCSSYLSHSLCAPCIPYMNITIKLKKKKKCLKLFECLTWHHLFLFFFLPFTWFSRLLSLWLITDDEEDLLWSITFGCSAGTELETWCMALACLSIEDNEKLGWGALDGGATGISGTPKNFLTPGALSTSPYMRENTLDVTQ